MLLSDFPGSTVVPGYYGMAPWGLYPTAGLIGAQQQRRPLTPTGGNEMVASNVNVNVNAQGQYQVIPAYYESMNGSLLAMGARGATPLRLVSPAPVLVNNPGKYECDWYAPIQSHICIYD